MAILVLAPANGSVPAALQYFICFSWLSARGRSSLYFLLISVFVFVVVALGPYGDSLLYLCPWQFSVPLRTAGCRSFLRQVLARPAHARPMFRPCQTWHLTYYSAR